MLAYKATPVSPQSLENMHGTYLNATQEVVVGIDHDVLQRGSIVCTPIVVGREACALIPCYLDWCKETGIWWSLSLRQRCCCQAGSGQEPRKPMARAHEGLHAWQQRETEKSSKKPANSSP